MAGKTRRTFTIDEKIELQEAEVLKAKDRYDAAMEELNRLVTKKKELDGRKLLEAFEKSERSLSEVLEFMAKTEKEDE